MRAISSESSLILAPISAGGGGAVFMPGSRRSQIAAGLSSLAAARLDHLPAPPGADPGTVAPSSAAAASTP